LKQGYPQIHQISPNNPEIFAPIRKELVMQSQDEVRRRVVESFGPMRLEAAAKTDDFSLFFWRRDWDVGGKMNEDEVR